MYCTNAHTYLIIKIFIHTFPPDINECNNGNGGCYQTCTNMAGTFICGCTSGFVLDHDGATCNG